MRTRIILAAFVALYCCPAMAQGSDASSGDTPTTEEPAAAAQPSRDRLSLVLKLDSVATGFANTPPGRMFVPLSHIDGSAGPQVVEWVNGKAVPYPDAAWNGWTHVEDAANAFVHVNALRIGPDGALWIVDVGAPGIGGRTVPHGPKIVKIDLASNTVVATYALDAVTKPDSYVDDIRFHGPLAYITDAGSPGLIVLDLKTGTPRRVLDGDPSVTGQRAMTAEDQILRGPDGKPVRIHVDQLEVSPDGKFLFYQPASGPMSRISTRYLDDPKLSTAELAKHITTYSKTGATGGTAIDANGVIYCSDTNKHRILTIDVDGHQRVLVQDPRLVWVDAMWLDAQGYLYMPAAQLDRMAPFNGGVSKVELPIMIFKMKIDAKPSPIDHP